MSPLTFTPRLALLLGLLVLLPVGVRAQAPQAYITNRDANTVSVIDTVSNTVTATVTVGGSPNGVAVTPDGAHVYVANGSDGTVSVIATATNTVSATVTVGEDPVSVAVTPDGAHAYVANTHAGTVSVIATASNTVTATVPVGNFPVGVAVTPDGAHVYVANEKDHSVAVIATGSNTVTATVPVGNFPRAFGKFISSPRATTPPVTTLAAQPGTLKDGRTLVTANATLTVSPSGLTIQTQCFDSLGLSVLLSATGGSSGVAQINYGSAPFVFGVQPPPLDHSIASASGTIPFLASGVFVLDYGAVDRAGNQEAAKSALVVVNSD